MLREMLMDEPSLIEKLAEHCKFVSRPTLAIQACGLSLHPEYQRCLEQTPNKEQLNKKYRPIICEIIYHMDTATQHQDLPSAVPGDGGNGGGGGGSSGGGHLGGKGTGMHDPSGAGGTGASSSSGGGASSAAPSASASVGAGARGSATPSLRLPLPGPPHPHPPSPPGSTGRARELVDSGRAKGEDRSCHAKRSVLKLFNAVRGVRPAVSTF